MKKVLENYKKHMTEQFSQDIDSDQEIQQMLEVIRSKQADYTFYHMMASAMEKLIKERRDARWNAFASAAQNQAMRRNLKAVTIKASDNGKGPIQGSGIRGDAEANPEE